MTLERLQKILSARGIASRRKAEEYILAGLVTVNGKKAELGQKADPEADTIEVDGQVMQERAEMLYYLLHKPVGVESTNVPGTPDAPTVRDILPPHLQGKIYPVGRLDKDSEGLLLLTNDGPLSFRLTHPKFEHEKEYDVTLKDEILDSAIEKLRKGVFLDGSKTKPAFIERVGKNVIRIRLTEGRNRQIRRMCAKVGSEVVRLVRTRITVLTDPLIRVGKLRSLSLAEKTQLLASVGL
jgi:pseudouridine synthase